MPDFDGETYDRDRDFDRLDSEYKRVFNLMRDARWRTLHQISVLAKCPEASASARLRDSRKEKFGGHTVERRYVENGLWEYRLIVRTQEPQQLALAV